MNKTQQRKAKSEKWKKQNGWGLTRAERTAKSISRAQQRIAEMEQAGKDASLIRELLAAVEQDQKDGQE